MNMVIDNAVEVQLAKGERDEVRRELGKHLYGACGHGDHRVNHSLGSILLKGDNVVLIQKKF
jgi:small nuclear ribonucleoprotein (snRNP)-like protein